MSLGNQRRGIGGAGAGSSELRRKDDRRGNRVKGLRERLFFIFPMLGNSKDEWYLDRWSLVLALM